MPTARTVRSMALKFPGAEERPSYGTPGFFAGKKIFARLLPGNKEVVVKIEYDQRALLMNTDPETFFITDHYRNYPMLIVRLSSVPADELRDLLYDAWQIAST
jgi:hypothetical protein